MSRVSARCRLALAGLLLATLAACASLRPGSAAIEPEAIVDEIWRDPAISESRLRSSLPTPELRHIAATMEARLAWLRPWLDLGAVGLDAEGYLLLTDAERIPPDQRIEVREWVAEDNADRVALYRAAASADAKGRSEAEFRALFSQVWQSRAAPAWRTDTLADRAADPL